MKKICFTILITLLVTVISYAQLAGGLKITSNPSNVTVKFNGVKKGVTPFKVILKAGSYTVTSEKYLNEFEKYYCKEKVTLIAGKINVLHLSLEKTYISAEKKAKKLAAENKIEVEKQAVIDLSRKKDLEANIGKFTDFRDNKTYKTIKIGKQIWMSENLAFNRYNESFAYNNDQDNVNKYGYLYIWKSAQYACPLGYHLPTKDEFKTLLDNYGGSSNIEANYVALMPSGNSGFFVLFGGWCNSSGNFLNKGMHAYFWSSSTKDDDNAWYLYIYGNMGEADINYNSRTLAFSVRCVKN